MGAVAFDKGGCQAMLRKHPALRGRVEQALEGQAANGMFKSKLATTASCKGLPIWECRINERSVGSVRAAFVLEGDDATVLFLSATLPKRAFGAELEQFLGRRRP